MNEVVASVKRVTDIMSEIALAGQEQSAGIAQVNQAIAQMDQVTQQNAALVEEAAAAADSMRDQATQLSTIVGRFKVADEAPRIGVAPKPLASRQARLVSPAVAVPVKSRWRSPMTNGKHPDRPSGCMATANVPSTRRWCGSSLQPG
jgi:methyl-accepting chemotaxis protein